MDPRTIFVKTAKGIGEIKNKTNHLPGKVRRLLILVDGRSTAAEIGTKISNLSESKRREAFEKLLSEGFVRESGIADGDLDEEEDAMLTATAVERYTVEPGEDEDEDEPAPPVTRDTGAKGAPDEAARKAREDEERRRWEAADRARIEAEERLRAQRDLERQDAEDRDRRAAEEKARWEGEQRSQLEKQMKSEAEAAERREAERRAKDEEAQQAPAQSERERIAAEEKKRLRDEHVAQVEEERQRVVAELLAKAKSDQEGKAQAEAEAKRRAYAETEAKKRAATKADKEAKTRQKIVEKAAKKPMPSYMLPAIGAGAVLLLVAAAGLLTLIPFSGDKPAIEKLIGERINEKVSVGALHVSLLPLPHLNLGEVVIGDGGDIKIDNITVPWDLFGGDPEKKSYRQVDLETVAIKQAALLRLADWTRVETSTPRLSVANLVLKNVRLTLNDVVLDPFDGQVTLASDGAFVKASAFLPDKDRLKGEIVAQDGVLAVSFSAKKWRAPAAEPLVFSELRFKGVARPGSIDVSDLEGVLADGTFKGGGRIEWGSASKLSAKLEISGMEIETMTPRFTQQVTLTGKLDAKLSVNAQSATLQTLFAAPKVEGEFALANGALGNVDLMKAIIEAPNYDKVRGGQTFFKKFSGNVVVADQRYQFRQLSMVSGSLTAGGSLDLAPDSTLAGKINLELGAEGNPVKDTVAFGGSLKEPVMRPSK